MGSAPSVASSGAAPFVAAAALPVLRGLDPATGEAALNSQAALKKPYVVLVSIDGFRWDYPEKFKTQNILAMAASGVRARRMRAVFPTKTFTNHMSLMTGQYPDRHGIVANEFYDSKLDKVYQKTQSGPDDQVWYQGLPLWNILAKSHIVTANFFWPPGDAAVQGVHPGYYLRYDESVPSERRAEEVVRWLTLDESVRPHFISLYLSDVDAASHRYGIESVQVRSAVERVDKVVGFLRSAFSSLNVAANLMVVSDHGMADVSPEKSIAPDASDYDLKHFLFVGRGPQMIIYLRPHENKNLLISLRARLVRQARRTGHFRVLTRAEMAARHYAANDRCGDLVIAPDLPWQVGLKGSMPILSGANHGWANEAPEMHAFFVAEGPAFARGQGLGEIRNIDVAPLILKIFALPPSSTMSGRWQNLRAALAH
jgi:predicted AlkP superfamily pyrophosphatase or phosphodiesterase